MDVDVALLALALAGSWLALAADAAAERLRGRRAVVCVAAGGASTSVQAQAADGSGNKGSKSASTVATAPKASRRRVLELRALDVEANVCVGECSQAGGPSLCQYFWLRSFARCCSLHMLWHCKFWPPLSPWGAAGASDVVTVAVREVRGSSALGGATVEGAAVRVNGKRWEPIATGSPWVLENATERQPFVLVPAFPVQPRAPMPMRVSANSPHGPPFRGGTGFWMWSSCPQAAPPLPGPTHPTIRPRPRTRMPIPPCSGPRK